MNIVSPVTKKKRKKKKQKKKKGGEEMRNTLNSSTVSEFCKALFPLLFLEYTLLEHEKTPQLLTSELV